MSGTGDPDDVTETERPLRTERPAGVAGTVWRLMHEQARELQDVREQAGLRVAESDERLRSLLVDLADAHHQLVIHLQRRGTVGTPDGDDPEAAVLGTIRDRYEQVLTRVGAELVHPDGEPFDLRSEGMVVTAWIPAPDLDRPRVRATVRPGVLLDGRLISPAQVEVSVPGTSGADREETVR